MSFTAFIALLGTAVIVTGALAVAIRPHGGKRPPPLDRRRTP